MLEIIAAAVFIVVAATTWQHLRFLRIRRDSAQDRQHLLHSVDVFHVVVFCKLRHGDKVVDTLRSFVQQIQTNGKAQLIYAGQAAFSVNSQQLGNIEWDGVLLLEYPSRSDYQKNLTDGHVHQARQYFADSYLHGMRRNRNKNLAIPLFLLRLRLTDILCGKWRVERLDPSPVFTIFPEYEIWRTSEARLRALNEINRQGLVVFRLVKHGTREQEAANDAFGRKMASRMAALGHGPLHMGRAVALEDFARFDQVFVIHYPSASYFADLLSSQFFQGAIGKKPPGDSLTVFTIPITDRL